MIGIGPWNWFEILQLLVWCSFALVFGNILYVMTLLALSRRTPKRDDTDHDQARGDWLVVFVIPCLNEGKVIGASIDRLLGLDADSRILVVDDGSDDDTAGVVVKYGNPRVQLLRRVEPNCRQGKGEAINAAFSYLVSSPLLEGRDPRRVIVAILDADGRLEKHALNDVLPLFNDPEVGGVQIGVRINNRHVNRLARMQDFEFVLFTDVFQRARRLLGSVGMGGNGQFMRLAALMSLGPRPWSRSLTEDLDLGVRLILNGWKTDYCPTAAVHQQGLVDFRRLVRQRTRWFQGHLQSWSLLPAVVRHPRGAARRDLQYHLTSPLLLLFASLLTLSFLIGAFALTVEAYFGVSAVGWWLLGVYALSFGPALAFSQVYYQRTAGEGVSRIRAALLGHLYVIYCLMWHLAGWRAVRRALIGDTSWAKTAREVETAESTLPSEVSPEAIALGQIGPKPTPRPVRNKPGKPASHAHPARPARLEGGDST